MSRAMDALLALMRRLRDPVDGCPWDREQTFASLLRHTLEEAYEVADAVEREDYADLAGELGDLLFQVVFHAQIAAELGHFDFESLATQLHEKLVRRHPHLFGRGEVTDAAAQEVVWERLKADERAAAGRSASELDGIPLALPALVRAAKLQKRASRVGFDWSSAPPVLDKVREELTELAEAMTAGTAQDQAEELGDLIFAVVNLARHLRIDPEDAMRAANAKFERRFRYVESALARSGRGPAEASLAEMDALWDEAKRLGM